MNSNKTNKWKKIFGIALAAIISAGSLAGIGYGAYKISNTTNISSDFSDGRSIQLNLRLFKTNSRNEVELDATNQPIRLYDKQTEEKNIKDSADCLRNMLVAKGLTNIKVSYGYSTIFNNQKVNGTDVFENQNEPIAILHASFENLETAFNLKDTQDKINTLFNDKQIYDNLNNAFAYEIEVVKPTYERGPHYWFANRAEANTFRDINSTILTNNQHQVPTTNEENIDSLSYFDTNLMLNDQINPFVNRDGKKDYNLPTYTLKDTLKWSYFNSYQFGQDNVDYLNLKKQEENSSQTNPQINNENSNIYTREAAVGGANNGTDGSSNEPSTPPAPATELQKFQTKYTWILWKDKQGLIDYLNSLIGIWYFNLYANNISGVDWSKDKDTILASLFPTSNELNKRNGTSTEYRKQINVVIDNLSPIEKSFIASIVKNKDKRDNNSSIWDPTNSLTWTPPLITEQDLIPVLYNFLNDSTFSPAPIDKQNLPNDNKDGVSESVKNGWSFLESTNTDLNSFIGQYYVGTIDYRNFNTFFQDPNKPKEPTNEDPNPIPDPFVTNQFKLNYSAPSNSYENIVDYLNNGNYKFPIITPNLPNFVTHWGSPYTDANGSIIDPSIKEQIEKLKSEYDQIQNGTNEQIESYNQKKEVFASKYFNGNNIYSQQYITPASIATSIISGSMNPLYILLIVLGSIVFIVGIFVSIRYRIPGVFAFITSGLVFVLSSILYNAFGFVFSFYSVLALAVGTFLSFIVPSFLFRNIEKEVNEGSTLAAAILKSTRKYWKMALDTHVMSLLASLSFLFFGKSGNVNFGAMLIISVFLSFILSGIIYFILLLFYVYVIKFDQNTWFVSNRLFNKISNNDFKFKKIILYNKMVIFTKPMYIVLAVLLLIGLAGSIFVAVHGPIISVDFSSSNILMINNFDYFNLTQKQIIDALKITSINSYVYDNQLVIYTFNKLDINNVLAQLRSLLPSQQSELSKILADNLIVSTLTNEFAISVVRNTIACMGIAIGFCAVWSLLSLNIVSVIPFALMQLLSMLVTTGLTSLIAIPQDISSIASFIFIFIISNAFSASLISSIKSSWDRKTLISKIDLKELINNIVSKINPNYIWISVAILAFAIFSLALSSVSLIFAFAIIIIGVIWLVLINSNMTTLTWFGFVLIRNMFNKELLKSKNEKLHIVHDYDSVNEQKIIGINC